MPAPSPHSLFVASSQCQFMKAGQDGLIVRVATGRGLDEMAAAFVPPEKLDEFVAWLTDKARAGAFQARLERIFRRHRGQEAVLARAVGVQQPVIARYREGLAVPEDDIARRIAARCGWDWPTVAAELCAARIAKSKALLEKHYVESLETDAHEYESL